VAAALAARETIGTEVPVIALATAHPAKFGDVIREELGFEPDIPGPWRDWQRRAVQAEELGGLDYGVFRAWLLGLAL
jgi:threonine synthase